MKLTEKEVRDLKAYGFDVEGNIKKPNGDFISEIIVMSNGRKNLHDSGYPFIKIIGKNYKNKFVDLGWHDHFICNVRVNIDSLGKNIFRVMRWSLDKKWKVRKNFIPLSTFQIGDFYDKENEFVLLS